jgi:hypothetical protein
MSVWIKAFLIAFLETCAVIYLIRSSISAAYHKGKADAFSEFQQLLKSKGYLE